MTSGLANAVVTVCHTLRARGETLAARRTASAPVYSPKDADSTMASSSATNSVGAPS